IAIDHKVQIGNILSVPIGDAKVPQAVLIEVCEQRTPAPLGGGDPRQLSNFTKGAIAVIQLEGGANVLGLIPVGLTGLELIIVIAHHGKLPAFVIFGPHIQHHYIHQAVVVDIGDVIAHAVEGQVGEIIPYAIHKGAVLLVDIQDVIG